MAAQTASASQKDLHIKSLEQKHAALSKKIEDAYKDLSSTDQYLSQLKKKKLIIKEKIASIAAQ